MLLSTCNFSMPLTPIMLQIPETVLALPVFYKQRENKVRSKWP